MDNVINMHALTAGSYNHLQMSANFAIQNVHSVLAQLIIIAANVPQVIFSLLRRPAMQHVLYFTME
jgi:hypothetical protein